MKNCHSRPACDRLTSSRVPTGSIDFISDHEKHSPEMQQLDEKLPAQTAAPHQHRPLAVLGMGGWSEYPGLLPAAPPDGEEQGHCAKFTRVLKHKTGLYLSLSTLSSLLLWWKSGGRKKCFPEWAQTCYYMKGCTKVKSLIPLIQTTNKQNPKNGTLEHGWALPGLLWGLFIHCRSDLRASS